MIASLSKAILHILDAAGGVCVLSDEALDVSDGSINSFISKHIERIFDDASLRKGEFTESSGFKYEVTEYLKTRDIIPFSQFAAKRLYDGVSSSDAPDAADVIVCEFSADEKNIIGILRFENKAGYTHQVTQDEGRVKNLIINHYAILPTTTQKISECAFIDLADMTVRYKGRNRNIDGEKVDLIADVLLECVYDISPRESVNAVRKIAKKVTEENGGDSLETMSRMKEYITENVEEGENKYIETDKVAEKIFDGLPSMREEFKEKLEKAQVPEKVEVNRYVTKRLSKDVKIVTDIGVEITFPAEYYSNKDYIEFINNDDGTISIQINNIGEVVNK